MNQLPPYSKLIVNHYTNKLLLTVTTIVHMTMYFIYHPPSECMGWDIYTPLHSTSARIYLMCLQSIWAGIYPLPFTAGRPGNITCLQSAWAGIYHSPSPRASQEISHASRDQSAWAKQCFSGDISLVRRTIISFYFSICSSLLEH